MVVGEPHMCNHYPGIRCPYCNPGPPYQVGDVPGWYDVPVWPSTTTDSVTVGPNPDLARLRTRIAELERLLAEEKAARGVAVQALRMVDSVLGETVYNAKAARNIAEQSLARIDGAQAAGS